VNGSLVAAVAPVVVAPVVVAELAVAVADVGQELAVAAVVVPVADRSGGDWLGQWDPRRSG
jgi:hypothetical protein